MKHSPVFISSLIAVTVLTSAFPAHATDSTWLGGSGVWSDAMQWSCDPIFPSNATRARHSMLS